MATRDRTRNFRISRRPEICVILNVPSRLMLRSCSKIVQPIDLIRITLDLLATHDISVLAFQGRPPVDFKNELQGKGATA